MEFWICLVFAVSTLLTTQANFFIPEIQRNLAPDAKLHINRQLRETRRMFPDCGHDDWLSSASVDQIDGAWELQMSNRPSSRVPESLCFDFSFSKINDTSTIMNIFQPKLDPRGHDYLCSYQDFGLYKCDERDRPIRNSIFLSIFTRSSSNAYMIFSPCKENIDYTYVISRRNLTLNSEDLENLDSLRQELRVETYYNIRQCN